MREIRRGTVWAAKSARNLLLDGSPPKIPFGLIIRKWQRKVIKESEDLLGPRKVGIEQIFGRSLFGWFPAFGKSLEVGQRSLSSES